MKSKLLKGPGLKDLTGCPDFVGARWNVNFNDKRKMYGRE